MKKSWFLLFLKKSISQRKGRVAVASVSVTLAVAVITGMIGITAGINEQLGSELKAYGANIIVSHKEGNYLDYDVVNKILKISGVSDAEGQVLDHVYIEGQSVEIIGLDIDKLRDRGWRLTGRWPADDHELLIGVNLKKALDLKEGRKVLLKGRGTDIDFVVTGFIEKGGQEDNAFILSVNDAWKLTGKSSRLSILLVRSVPGELDRITKEISTIVPGAAAKTFRQVAVSEESLLKKIQLLMAMVTIVVLLAGAVSVASTMGANVLERREEIGLMVAIGATKKKVRLFYTAEAALIGLLGSLAGFILGYFLTQVISKGAFDSYISAPFYLVFISVITGLGISLLAGHFPVRNALKYSPAEILRGE